MADTVVPNRNLPSTLAEIGGTIRAPWWPTIPRQSTNPAAWSIIRYYSCGISAADTPAYGVEIQRTVRFSLPSTLLGWNAGVGISDGSGLPIGMNPLDLFKVKFETENGEKITIDSRRGGSVLGDGKHMGHIGGSGWPFIVGENLVVTITPYLPGLAAGVYLEVDLSFPVLETRIGSSVVVESTAAMSKITR